MEGYMNNLLSANISNATAWGTILVVVLVIFLVIFFAIIANSSRHGCAPVWRKRPSP